MHELCYATSDSLTEGFQYGGVVVSNCDLHIDSYKPADMPTASGANNHGSIVEINGQWYIFIIATQIIHGIVVRAVQRK